MSRCVYEDCGVELIEMNGCKACGRCQCGCSDQTTIRRVTRLDRGYQKGFPARYVMGHKGVTRLGWPSDAVFAEWHRQGLCPTSIAALLGDRLGRAVCDISVRNHLIRIGLTPWSRSEAQSLYCKRNEEAARDRAATARKSRNGRGGYKATAQHMRKMTGRAVAVRLARNPPRVCKNCGKEFRVKPSKKQDHCSRSCAISRRNRLLARGAIAEVGEARAFPVPEWARENVERLRELQNEAAG